MSLHMRIGYTNLVFPNERIFVPIARRCHLVFLTHALHTWLKQNKIFLNNFFFKLIWNKDRCAKKNLK